MAFVNPDGAKTVVLSNTGAARKTQLRLGNLMTEVSLPANSITNLSWVCPPDPNGTHPARTPVSGAADRPSCYCGELR